MGQTVLPLPQQGVWLDLAHRNSRRSPPGVRVEIYLSGRGQESAQGSPRQREHAPLDNLLPGPELNVLNFPRIADRYAASAIPALGRSAMLPRMSSCAPTADPMSITVSISAHACSSICSSSTTTCTSPLIFDGDPSARTGTDSSKASASPCDRSTRSAPSHHLEGEVGRGHRGNVPWVDRNQRVERDPVLRRRDRHVPDPGQGKGRPKHPRSDDVLPWSGTHSPPVRRPPLRSEPAHPQGTTPRSRVSTRPSSRSS